MVDMDHIQTDVSFIGWFLATVTDLQELSGHVVTYVFTGLFLLLLFVSSFTFTSIYVFLSIHTGSNQIPEVVKGQPSCM